MKKSAIPAKKPTTAAKLLAKKPNPRIKPLVIHIAFAALASVASYMTVQHFVVQEQNQSTQAFATQAATLIDRQIASWQAESALLAQQPTLKSTSTVKAVIPADGTLPASLSLSDQDLLNRTHAAATGAEASQVGGQIQITTAVAIPGGGYLISTRPFTQLANDLQHSIPATIQLTLSQQVGGGDPLQVLKIHDNPEGTSNVPLQSVGWQLQVGAISANNPQHNLPLWAALITLFGSLIPIIAWFTVKFQYAPAARVDLSPEAQRSALDAVAMQLTPHEDDIAQPPAPARPQAAAEFDMAELLDLDKPAQPATAPESSPVVEEAVVSTPQPEIVENNTPSNAQNNAPLEFKLNDSPMLPDLDFFLSNDSLPRHIFRAYDIRGKVTDLTAELIQPIARALGSELRSRSQVEVVVGYDARTTSESYAQIMRNGLIECGLRVFDIGCVPTPVMHYAARKRQGNGIMITASHSPADYNGIKWLMQSQSPLPEDIQKIYQRAASKSFTDGKGRLTHESFTAEYLDDMLNDVILSEDLTVIIDGMNGTMGQIAQQAIETSGYTVIDLDIKPDGSYPNGNPDPCEPHRLDNLSDQMALHQADIGLAFDGDGDRLVVVDKNGTVVTSDQLIALFAMMVLESKPGADIVFDVKCSRMVSQTITTHGGRPIMSRSGNTFIRHAVMAESNEVAFGGEFSGHYFFNDGRGHASDDGLYAAMRLLEWLGQRGETLTDILKALPTRVGTPDIYVPLDGDLPANFFTELAADAAQVAGATMTTIDGVRLDFQDGFGIIRASNTGASITLRFEADNATSVARIRQTFYDLLAKHLPNLAAKIPPV